MNTWSSWAYFTAHPAKYHAWWKELYGNIKPQPNRWHTSTRFDLCEAAYKGPFSNSGMFWEPQPPKGKDPYITDVEHHRQVLLVRQPGLVVVTDRICSDAVEPHKYQLTWAFAAPCPTNQSRVKEVYGFTPDQIRMDAAGQALHTMNSNMVNLSIYHFSPTLLKMDAAGCMLEGTGTQLVVSALYPRRTVNDGLTAIRPLPAAGAGAGGFEATLPDGTKVLYAGAADRAPLELGNVEVLGEGLLLTIAANGETHGVALGCTELGVKSGKREPIKPEDFEFELVDGKLGGVMPIYRPLDFVRVSPESDRFMDRVEITMTHPEPDVDIRYTLDRTDPMATSPLYTVPFTLLYSATVKARAFRKGVKAVPPTFSGTEVSSVTRAEYTKEKPLEPATTVAVAPGLKYSYYEGDFSLSALYLDTLVKSKKQGTVADLFDLSARATSNNFAFVYDGYLDIPRDGVYDFHAPRELVLPSSDAGYDLRVFVDKEEWYPATRPHNFGIWSVALKKGKHAFKVVYVDQRPGEAQWRYPYPQVQPYKVWRGEKPTLEISGPGLAKQPIPAGMLYY
jgi:hypothetical protein